MKSINFTLIALLAIFSNSCTKTEDGENNPDPMGNESFVEFSVMGNVVNGTYKIPLVEKEGSTTILGHMYKEDSNEGVLDVASVYFTQFGDNYQYREVKMVLPAHTGSFEVGESVAGPSGTYGNPIFDAGFLFEDDDYILYDSDNDGDDDRLQDLLQAKTLSVTVTNIEETTNSLGIKTLASIKGTFEGVAYFEAFTGPYTAPQILTHTVSGKFQYFKSEEE
ncbi:hypothetical protein LAG90_04780 [Marinilongibacter aquaticus]|uniref:hypothetical protein n=1 Tax=Marinilongibacter aquaticus TaxID=2975157 RepID=UPI0021BDE09D|nr:hypothetical protein [Marinilongibacter aquaticus]UBM59963.1 hypothetical protein LAG90_04780 [Marinilongibacter aquaticus]